MDKNLGLGEGSALPVGVPVPWPSEIPPSGWLKCNGAAFSATEYPFLAKAYPSLKLPDLRGEFIRGWDDGKGADSGRSILSWQKGSYLIQETAPGVDRVVQFSLNNINSLGWDKTESNGDIIRARSAGDSSTGTWSASPTGGDGTQYLGYTRPRNIALNYIVRAA
ncbi:phage tail protein [Pantoea ananatis]|uniref:phage tail protein n=1 Tax=Pantoea ananas TaxID=553 RepID=UPI001FF08613|nr:phage tail protein [Pantoea ananatis]